jgi:molybdopterin-guanine dinucleotide biosynthesis protein A
MIHDIPAVIFAGGKSSRMGKDKALLPFGGYDTLAQYQYKKLKKIFENVYISTKKNKFDFKAPLILDTYEVNSPLGAIISVLQYTQKPTFILSVDAPFVSKDIILQLISHNDTYNLATIAKSSQGLEPLCGIYNPSFIPIAQKQISQNNHKLNYILKNHNITTVYFNDTKAFLNLNYPSDYETALKI